MEKLGGKSFYADRKAPPPFRSLLCGTGTRSIGVGGDGGGRLLAWAEMSSLLLSRSA